MKEQNELPCCGIRLKKCTVWTCNETRQFFLKKNAESIHKWRTSSKLTFISTESLTVASIPVEVFSGNRNSET